MKKILAIGLAALAVTIAVAAMTFAAPVATANEEACLMWASTTESEGTVDLTWESGDPSYATDAATVGCWQAFDDCYIAGYTVIWMDSSYADLCSQT